MANNRNDGNIAEIIQKVTLEMILANVNILISIYIYDYNLL